MKLKSKIQKEFYKSMLMNIPEESIFEYVMDNMYDEAREAVFENEQGDRNE